MLNKNQLELIPDRIYQRLNNINTEYLVSIGEVLKDIGELRPTDIHQLQQMYNFGSQTDKMARMLSEATQKNTEDIYKLFDAVAKDNYTFAKPFYEAKLMDYIPYEENIPLQRKVRAMAKQTVDEYVNLSQHTAFAVFSKDGKSIAPYFAANKDKIVTPASEVYNKISDYAITQVQLGMESYNKAVTDIIKTMSASGIRTVDYATGYSRRLDTAVRQNVLWAVKECNQQTANLVGEEFGADGMEVDYHSYPRPKHEAIGGRQFALGSARTVNGVYYQSFEEVAKPLLEEYGCLHFSFSIILGVSRPAYTEEELQEYAKADKATFEFEGRKYTLYGGTQLQRKVETELRHQRDILNMAKAAGNGDTELIARTKIRILTDKYAELSNVSGLPTQMDRIKSVITVKNNSAAKAAIRNTNKVLKFDPKANFKVELDGFSDKVNEGLSKAAYKVAEMGGRNKLEYLSLIDLKTGEELYFEEGTEQSVGFGEYRKFLRENRHRELAFIHNHNTDGYFSETDMLSLLNTNNIKVFGAIRLDGVKYFAEKRVSLNGIVYVDELYENELKDLNYKSRNGIITAGERTRRREEIIVDGLLRDYTKGLIELDGRS